MASRWRPLPRRSLDEVLEAYPEVRQSRLADFDNCALTALLGLEGYDFNNRAQARGILFHRFAAEVLRTLWRTGETRIAVGDALAILYEQCAQRDVADADVVLVPAGERRLLRIAAVMFANENTFDMARMVAVEKRLYATVRYPHPDTGATVERTITGQPDAILSDPDAEGGGAIVLDWKTTRKPPPRYQGDRDDVEEGVSYMGYFQQRFYALLVFANYTSVQRVTLREFYPLAERGDRVRTATVHIGQVEHLQDEFATQVELMDRALAGGSRSAMWQPQPGRHCSFCPKPTRCPIEADVRAFAAGGDRYAGGITTLPQARRLAAEYVLAKSTGGTLHEALKSWVEVHGAVVVKSAKGRYEVGWHATKSGGRQFGVGVPAESDRGPLDENLEAAFAEAAERRNAA